jgi:hypothetical protein
METMPKVRQTYTEHWSCYRRGWNVSKEEPKKEGLPEEMERAISQAIEVLNKIR